MVQNKKPPASTQCRFAGGPAGVAMRTRGSPVALRHRLSTALLCCSDSTFFYAICPMRQWPVIEVTHPKVRAAGPCILCSWLPHALPVSPISRWRDRKSTRLNSSHGYISYAVFCLKKKKNKHTQTLSAYHEISTQYNEV